MAKYHNTIQRLNHWRLQLSPSFANFNNCTTSLCPFLTASWSGVFWDFCSQSTRQLRFQSSNHIAGMSGVLTFPSALGLLFAVSSSCTAPLCPLQAAWWSGVSLYTMAANNPPDNLVLGHSITLQRQAKRAPCPQHWDCSLQRAAAALAHCVPSQRHGINIVKRISFAWSTNIVRWTHTNRTAEQWQLPCNWLRAHG